jgi:hypothetical protein
VGLLLQCHEKETIFIGIISTRIKRKMKRLSQKENLRYHIPLVSNISSAAMTNPLQHKNQPLRRQCWQRWHSRMTKVRDAQERNRFELQKADLRLVHMSRTRRMRCSQRSGAVEETAQQGDRSERTLPSTAQRAKSAKGLRRIAQMLRHRRRGVGGG